MINLPASVAICAMSRTGRMDVSGYEMVIGINNTHTQVDISPDLIIAMDDLKRDEKTDPAYVKAIAEKGCPVLSTRKFRKWPNVRPYPIEKVAKYFRHQTGLPPHKLLDNSICYAVALCISNLVGRIGLSGVDFTRPYAARDLDCATVRWKHKGYGHAPEWFRFYDREVLKKRYAQECGWESLHYLIGFGTALGIRFEWGKDTTLLNMDRDDFYYGYANQPRL